MSNQRDAVLVVSLARCEVTLAYGWPQNVCRRSISAWRSPKPKSTLLQQGDKRSALFVKLAEHPALKRA